MKCYSCNREFNTDRDYCPFCGEKIEENIQKNAVNTTEDNNSNTSVEASTNPQQFYNTPLFANPVNNNGLVPLQITREKRFMGWAIPFSVFVDGVKVGDLKNGTSLSCQVGFGSHDVLIKCVEKDVHQNIIVNANHQSVEVVARAKMGLLAAVAKITNVIYK